MTALLEFTSEQLLELNFQELKYKITQEIKSKLISAKNISSTEKCNVFFDDESVVLIFNPSKVIIFQSSYESNNLYSSNDEDFILKHTGALTLIFSAEIAERYKELLKIKKENTQLEWIKRQELRDRQTYEELKRRFSNN
jgi:hypothetical protein